MVIKRVEFLSFTVAGPRGSVRQNFKPIDWPRWTARAEGQAILLEGDGRRIEIPRNRCVVEWGDDSAVQKAREEHASNPLPGIPEPKRRGRPPKVKEEPNGQVAE